MSGALIQRDAAHAIVIRDAAPRRLVVGGFRGLPGKPGQQGEQGNGITVRDVFTTLAALQAAHPTGSIGDAYAVGAHLYVWGEAASTWIDAGLFQGPPGKPGQIRFTGIGPPPAYIPGAEPGDTYMDLATGVVYTDN